MGIMYMSYMHLLRLSPVSLGGVAIYQFSTAIAVAIMAVLMKCRVAFHVDVFFCVQAIGTCVGASLVNPYRSAQFYKMDVSDFLPEGHDPGYDSCTCYPDTLRAVSQIGMLAIFTVCCGVSSEQSWFFTVWYSSWYYISSEIIFSSPPGENPHAAALLMAIIGAVMWKCANGAERQAVDLYVQKQQARSEEGKWADLLSLAHDGSTEVLGRAGYFCNDNMKSLFGECRSFFELVERSVDPRTRSQAYGFLRSMQTPGAKPQKHEMLVRGDTWQDEEISFVVYGLPTQGKLFLSFQVKDISIHRAPRRQETHGKFNVKSVNATITITQTRTRSRNSSARSASAPARSAPEPARAAKCVVAAPASSAPPGPTGSDEGPQRPELFKPQLFQF
jgi:hypothetical protein